MKEALQLQEQQAANAKAALESEMQQQQAAANAQAQLALEAQKLAAERAMFEQGRTVQAIAQQAELYGNKLYLLQKLNPKPKFKQHRQKHKHELQQLARSQKGRRVAEVKRKVNLQQQHKLRPRHNKQREETLSSEVAAHAKVELLSSNKSKVKLKLLHKRKSNLKS